MPTETHINKFINEFCSAYVMFDEEVDEEDCRFNFNDIHEIWSTEAECSVERFIEIIVDRYFESREDYAQEIQKFWEETSDDIETMIQDFTSNSCPTWMMSKYDGRKFLERKEVIDWAQEMMPEVKIKSLSPTLISEACVRSYFGSRLRYDRKSIQRGPRFADGYLPSECGTLRKGLIEIRGYGHLENGTDDKKLMSLVDKFEGYLRKEWMSVILCGELSTYSKKLVDKTELYQFYLNDDLDTPLTETQKALFAYWKLLKFNGFFTVDSIFEGYEESEDDECESGSEDDPDYNSEEETESEDEDYDSGEETESDNLDLDNKMKVLLEEPDLEKVMTLIRLGANPNVTNDNGCNVLFNYLGHIQTSDQLTITDDLRELVKISDRCEFEGLTPLHFAVAYENEELIKSLVDTDKYKDDLENILAYAMLDDETNEICHKCPCSLKVVKFLIELGASLDAEFDDRNLLDLLDASYAFMKEDKKQIREVLKRHGLKKSEIDYTPKDDKVKDPDYVPNNEEESDDDEPLTPSPLGPKVCRQLDFEFDQED